MNVELFVEREELVVSDIKQQNAVSVEFEDYSQSANTLFHFVKEPTYLKDILTDKALKPRYCREDIRYLNLKSWEDILILQKCFCDIPLEMLTRNTRIQIIDPYDLTKEDITSIEKQNSHTDFYGKFGIGFTKTWGESNHLQQVQYINQVSELSLDIRGMFNYLMNQNDVADVITEDFIYRLAYLKPLRGRMLREYELAGGEKKNISILKNFHDEKEWRYIPNRKQLVEYRQVIANRNIVNTSDAVRLMNNMIQASKKELWLPIEYDSIRYLIVPTVKDRMDLIEFIVNLPSENFIENAEMHKYLLVSKIMVLDELRKDV